MATKFITVSIEIMHNKDLNQSQKFMLAEIEQLSSLEKGCIATNEHFAKLIGITKENVSRNLNNLRDKGYIKIEIKNGSRNHVRIITLIKIASLTTLATPPYQSSKPPLLKQQETIENKTINKTTNIHIYSHFDKLWLMYPSKKRIDKNKVTLDIKKKVFDINEDEWKRILDRYSKTYSDIKYCKHGVRFFNNETYQEFRDEIYQQIKQDEEEFVCEVFK
jgi:DNA-binding MarR family transcriptional regulator